MRKAVADNGATFEAVAENRFRAAGNLTFATVPGVLERSRGLFAEGTGAVEVSLEGVERADSAGVALLIEWVRTAAAAGREIRFRAVPRQIRDIANVSGVESILPLSDG